MANQGAIVVYDPSGTPTTVVLQALPVADPIPPVVIILGSVRVYPTYPGVGDVRQAVVYGPMDVEFTGTLAPGGGGGVSRSRTQAGS